jgi:hypothetical protein
LIGNPSPIARIASLATHRTICCHADTAGFTFEITRPSTNRGRGCDFGSPRISIRTIISPVPSLHSALKLISVFLIRQFCVYLLFYQL